MPQLVILQGVPGCGKSTHVETQYPQYKVVDPDKILLSCFDINVKKGEWNELLRLPAKIICKTLIKGFVAQGKNIVYDDCNSSQNCIEDLLEYLDLPDTYDVHIINIHEFFGTCCERRQHFVGVEVLQKVQDELVQNYPLEKILSKEFLLSLKVKGELMVTRITYGKITNRVVLKRQFEKTIEPEDTSDEY